jgi:hypothetical protein
MTKAEAKKAKIKNNPKEEMGTEPSENKTGCMVGKDYHKQIKKIKLTKSAILKFSV